MQFQAQLNLHLRYYVITVQYFILYHAKASETILYTLLFYQIKATKGLLLILPLVFLFEYMLQLSKSLVRRYEL